MKKLVINWIKDAGCNNGKYNAVDFVVDEKIFRFEMCRCGNGCNDTITRAELKSIARHVDAVEEIEEDNYLDEAEYDEVYF